jgi:hypothetical protein
VFKKNNGKEFYIYMNGWLTYKKWFAAGVVKVSDVMAYDKFTLSSIISNDMEQFKKVNLSSEDAFWVMWYFLEAHYELSGGTFDVSDILSASQPIELDANGHIDGKVLEGRVTTPADSGMISFWNDAIERFLKEGKPSTKMLE